MTWQHLLLGIPLCIALWGLLNTARIGWLTVDRAHHRRMHQFYKDQAGEFQKRVDELEVENDDLAMRLLRRDHPELVNEDAARCQ